MTDPFEEFINGLDSDGFFSGEGETDGDDDATNSPELVSSFEGLDLLDAERFLVFTPLPDELSDEEMAKLDTLKEETDHLLDQLPDLATSNIWEDYISNLEDDMRSIVVEQVLERIVIGTALGDSLADVNADTVARFIAVVVTMTMITSRYMNEYLSDDDDTPRISF